MPNVFVTPPVEDQVPTWCCFDAANPSLSQGIERPEPKEIPPIAFSPDDAYYASAGYVATTTAMSIVDDAITYQRPELEDDIETISDYGHELEDQDISLPTRDLADDSDVVEVVKLRRQDRHDSADPETVQQPPQTKRPNSLKSRASRAFKSLTGSLRSKSRTQDIVSSSSSTSSSQNEHDAAQSQQDSAPSTSRSRTPTALRRGSGVLSQLFTTPIRTQSSFDEPALASPTSPTYPKYSLSESSSSVQNKHLFSTSSSYQTSLQDQARLDAASPSLTTTSRKSSRRFSMLSLQKLFSFGSATPEEAEDSNLANNIQPEEPDMTTATPVLRSVPSTPAFSSSSSNSGPETPTSAHYQIPVRLVTSSNSMDGAPDFPAFDTLDALFDSNQNLNLGLGLGLSLPTSSQRAEPSTPRKSFSASSSMWGSITPKARKKSAPPCNEADSSLEMRLDSLHFDSLSFDIDRFSLK